MTDTDLLDALRDCYVPLLGRNIVDARLVRTASLTRDRHAPGANIRGATPRFRAHITLVAPGSDGAANAQLAAQIQNRLLGLEAISHVEVTILPALFPILTPPARPGS